MKYVRRHDVKAIRRLHAGNRMRFCHVDDTRTVDIASSCYNRWIVVVSCGKVRWILWFHGRRSKSRCSASQCCWNACGWNREQSFDVARPGWYRWSEGDVAETSNRQRNDEIRFQILDRRGRAEKRETRDKKKPDTHTTYETKIAIPPPINDVGTHPARSHPQSTKINPSCCS